MPLFSVPSSKAPNRAPTIDPLPPDKLAPPRMTAEIFQDGFHCRMRYWNIAICQTIIGTAISCTPAYPIMFRSEYWISGIIGILRAVTCQGENLANVVHHGITLNFFNSAAMVASSVICLHNIKPHLAGAACTLSDGHRHGGRYVTIGLEHAAGHGNDGPNIRSHIINLVFDLACDHDIPLYISQIGRRTQIGPFIIWQNDVFVKYTPVNSVNCQCRKPLILCAFEISILSFELFKNETSPEIC